MLIDWKSFRKKRTPEKGKQFPTGSAVYFGFQGQGKTLAMTAYAFRIKEEFPDCVIFSNYNLYGIDYHYCFSDEDVKNALSFQNGSKGVLVLLDEAHLYFGKKTGIGLETLTAISQQRKDKRRIVFTSQIWEELDISLRKQVKEIHHCHKVMNLIIQNVCDGETLSYDKMKSEYVAKHIRYEIFKMNDEYFNRYNTYQKIVTNDEMVAPLATRSPTASQAEPLIVKKGIL